MKKIKIGVITTINSQDGIATYSKQLFRHIEPYVDKLVYLSNKDISDRESIDEDNVIRCWSTGENSFEQLFETIEAENLNIISIQYHSLSQFSYNSLNLLVKKLKQKNIFLILTLHSVRYNSFNIIKEVKNLHLIDKILIHNLHDYEYAKKYLDNVILFRHPKLNYKLKDKSYLRKQLGLDNYYPIIFTHGFLNSKKTDLSKVVKSIEILKTKFPNILYIALNSVSNNNFDSQGEFKKLLNLVKTSKLENNILFIPNFLNEEQIELLVQVGDVNVVSYKEVGESASGAIDKLLASENPTIVPDIKMFSELEDEIFKIKEISPETLSDTIVKLITNKELKDSLTYSAKKYISKFSYSNQAKNFLKIINVSNT